MKKCTLILTVLIVTAFTTNAQWTQTNFPTGISNIQSIAVNGNNIFAGTISNGVYLSTNSGSTWTAINNGLTYSWVESLAIIGNNIFAGNYVYGVYLSTNNGASWAYTSAGPTMVYQFAVSGSNIFAAGLNGVWLSSNNGTNWTNVLSNHTVMSLAINGSTIYAGTDSSKVYKSTNNGTNWSLVNNGLPATPYQIQALAICGNYVYAALWGSGIYLSNNGGANWSFVNNGLFTCIYSLAADGSKIFASGGPISLSNDNGANWINVSSGLPTSGITSLTINGTYMYAGVFISANNCSVWKCSLSTLTGVEEEINENSNFVVYPNPATDIITVNINRNSNADLTLNMYNVLGVLVKTEIVQQNQQTINISDISNGIYIVEIKSKGLLEKHKLVIKR